MSEPNQLMWAGTPIEILQGDTILAAVHRVGIYPTGGGPLCGGGDCANCLATVDGVAYVRTCQTIAIAGVDVEPHPVLGNPPPPRVTKGGETALSIERCDVVVVGAGRAGSQAAALASGRVVVLDAAAGAEVVGIYQGPMVVVRTSNGMRHIYAQEIIVATGSAEIQPVCEGSHLAGIYTQRGAEAMSAQGVELPNLVEVGPELVRFEGDRRVRAVIVQSDGGSLKRIGCESVIVRLGKTPRDSLARMGTGLPVTVVGSAALDGDVPRLPSTGVVCPCTNLTIAQLTSIYDRGFTKIELLKRASLAGTGTCQGGVCLPYLKSFLSERGGAVQSSFTARPVTRQLTLGEVAAGVHHQAGARTALHHEHLAWGARMDRVGGWWRPWRYPDTDAEYHAVRTGVSLGDVSTLGKLVVSGPDAVPFLERIYPSPIGDMTLGESRYVINLDERGYMFDDGLVCRETASRFTLTTTSAGATHVELWLRDWAQTWEYEVRILNRSGSVGAINVTGPHASLLLAMAGLEDPPEYMRHSHHEVAGVACHVFRLSFTGEASFELHHSAAESVGLWRSLMQLGSDLQIYPHGVETLMSLRLEKGHVIVGQDTDLDTSPLRAGMAWAVHMDKTDFIGREGLICTNAKPLNRKLVGLEMEPPAPNEGAVLWRGDTYAGSVTSVTESPTLGKVVMLASMEYIDGELPREATVEGRVARRVRLPFYDPKGERARG